MKNWQKCLKILKSLQNYPLESAKNYQNLIADICFASPCYFDHFHYSELSCLTKVSLTWFLLLPLEDEGKWCLGSIGGSLGWKSLSIKCWFLSSIFLHLTVKRWGHHKLLWVSITNKGFSRFPMSSCFIFPGATRS